MVKTFCFLDELCSCFPLRATTYYLADRRYDMLPAVLSADLCSLLGGVDRSVLSAPLLTAVSIGPNAVLWFPGTP